jgi:hypothetical protein
MMEPPTIVVPHDPARGRVVGVKRMLVHSSLAELQQRGLFDRYRTFISAQSLDEINELIGPGWMPIELAFEHYNALDQLALPEDQIYSAGVKAGAKIGDALLVAGAHVGTQTIERSPWKVVGAFSRMGRRIYEGGSTQYVKLSENQLLMEHRGNPLYALNYCRIAHGGFLKQTYGALGIELTDIKMSTYREDGAQLDVRLTWK